MMFLVQSHSHADDCGIPASSVSILHGGCKPSTDLAVTVPHFTENCNQLCMKTTLKTQLKKGVVLSCIQPQACLPKKCKRERVIHWRNKAGKSFTARLKEAHEVRGKMRKEWVGC